MPNRGWIKLHTCLFDKAIWTCSTAEQKAVLMTILTMANWKENQWHWRGRKFTCQPGQFVTSSTKLAEKAGVSRQNVRSALAKFQNYEFLTYESTKTGLLVTVTNWALYQSKPTEPTKEPTKNQPTGNQEVTTIEDYKTIRHKDNIYTPEFEKWYAEWPRPQAKRDSARNFERVRKAKGLDYVLMCTVNYLTWLKAQPPDQLRYASNNFFGQKAYYLDYEKPKAIPKRAATTKLELVDSEILRQSRGY